jgi:hypothetical protein
MLVYWSMVLVPALLAFTQSVQRRKALDGVMLAVLFVWLFVFLALRETGGDYETYMRLFDILSNEPLELAVVKVEPIYGFLNWASAQMDMGIYGVNAACALIFLFCLYRAAGKERYPFFFVTLAIPYFVIVVAMGYTRQGVAAGLLLLAMIYLREGRPWRACAAILLGAGFHYSEFAALALPIIVGTRNHTGLLAKLARAVLAGAFIYLAYYLFSEQVDSYTTNYIDSDRYVSDGAFLRSIVTGAAGVIFLVFARNYRQLYDDYLIWRPFAVIGLLCVPLSLVASTPVDRVGLYLIPFQLVAFTRLPAVIDGGSKFVGTKAAVLLAYLAYFFVWLHLGSFANELWLPYRWIFS